MYQCIYNYSRCRNCGECGGPERGEVNYAPYRRITPSRDIPSRPAPIYPPRPKYQMTCMFGCTPCTGCNACGCMS